MTNAQIADKLRGQQIEAVQVTGREGAHVVTLTLNGDTLLVTFECRKISVVDQQINV
jgi:hypothetical protein